MHEGPNAGVLRARVVDGLTSFSGTGWRLRAPSRLPFRSHPLRSHLGRQPRPFWFCRAICSLRWADFVAFAPYGRRKSAYGQWTAKLTRDSNGKESHNHVLPRHPACFCRVKPCQMVLDEAGKLLPASAGELEIIGNNLSSLFKVSIFQRTGSPTTVQ